MNCDVPGIPSRSTDIPDRAAGSGVKPVKVARKFCGAVVSTPRCLVKRPFSLTLFSWTDNIYIYVYAYVYYILRIYYICISIYNYTDTVYMYIYISIYISIYAGFLRFLKYKLQNGGLPEWWPLMHSQGGHPQHFPNTSRVDRRAPWLHLPSSSCPLEMPAMRSPVDPRKSSIRRCSLPQIAYK